MFTFENNIPISLWKDKRLHSFSSHPSSGGFSGIIILFKLIKKFFNKIIYFVTNENLKFKPVCIASQAGSQCQIATMTTHNLHNKTALMTESRSNNSVYGFDNAMESRVSSNCHVRTAKVIVDGANEADYIQEPILLLLLLGYFI